MDFLKAEIERKRKQIEKANVVGAGKKYYKRGELTRKEQEEKLAKKQKLENPETTKETECIYAPTVISNDESEDKKDQKMNLSRREVVRRLRERNEPILLFGENEYEAWQRLKKLELLEPEVNKGQKNDFKAAMDKVDQKYLNEMSRGLGDAAKKAYDVVYKDAGMKTEDMEIMANELGIGNPNRDQEILLQFMQYILQKWGEELNARDVDRKKSTTGKLEAATHGQTVEYLKPLFKCLKTKTCTQDILLCLVDVCQHLLLRDYIRANEAYMEMAIGNAPWPIGVTMVGIHARTGREKIFDKNVAHVLNDEIQRKYIQGFKRLMTRAQRYFPTDPSRMVNFEKPTDT